MVKSVQLHSLQEKKPRDQQPTISAEDIIKWENKLGT